MKFKNILILAILLVLGTNVNAQWKKNKANEDTKIWRYDLECEGIAKQGSKLVKVWSYSKNPKHAISRGMKNAVHGIIFKGYAGGGQGCTPLKPLVKSVDKEEKFKAFFDAFFADGGEYLKYVSAATDGSIAPGDRLKVSRREYKIGVIVNIQFDQLRKRLESEGISKGLASGF
ncbi:hypothetical protein Q4Q34_08920 [Flavivirga abyssicola]|uniref:hypothetical protein n=1 Tax=Flavivirga abyssicola TaxID=3063533 RepID=UPI0026DF2782|nr:hypothetical protein [Flavivirga sp. MEBiC07777]WVK15149.1 hypothetical protein Q4Q34_08920 [Flavivirga sp. MEBiC07777]